MKIIKDKTFLKSLAEQLDLLNTIGGGISETQIEVKKYKKGTVLQIWAAGINPESYKIILHNNQLTIYSVLHSENNPQLAAPLFNRVFILPPAVDLNRIEAVYKEGQLQVKLPYYSSVNQPEEIEIKRL